MDDHEALNREEAIRAGEIVVETLCDARRLLAAPGRWTRETLARDASGDECDPTGPTATCFCAIGAVYARAPVAHLRETAVDRLFEAIPDPFTELGIQENVVEFNDAEERTLDEVLAWFDRAIELARAT